MTTERRQVLDMLAGGKISAEEAERLLEKLGDPSGGDRTDPVERAGETAGARPKFLRVLVTSTQGDEVNIRVPLALVRTGIKLSTMLPSHANERLAEKGIDLSQLSGLEGDELVDALRELTVDVDSAEGDKVRIFCE